MYQYGSFSYSIDKIKLKCKLNKFSHYSMGKIRSWCEGYLPEWIELISASDNCFTAFKYRFSHTLRVRGETEGVFYVAEWYNGDFREQKEKPEQFLIEYNPNKSGERIYKEFCNQFDFRIVEILQFDLAYDVPGATANDVRIDTRCDVMTYGKTSNRTTYIAPKEDKSGRVKVYTKSFERAEHGVEMSDTLRIEVTVKCKGLDFNTVYLNGNTLDQFTKCVEHLNAVKIKQRSAETDDWKIYALSHLSPEDLQKVFGMMAYEARRKYRKLITEAAYYTLSLDVFIFTSHICTVLNPWMKKVTVK